MPARSVPNPDGSSTIYVHHLSHGAPATPAPPPPPQPQMQMQMPPMMYPMPMMTPPPPPQPMYSPYPSYPPPPPLYGCPHYYHQQQLYQQQQQQQQPAVVVIQNEPPKPEPQQQQQQPTAVVIQSESPKPKPPPAPQEFSRFSIVSIIVFALALISGATSIIQTYMAHDELTEGLNSESEVEIPNDENEEYMVHRTMALGMGFASVMCFTIATLCSFYAGTRHQAKATKEHCCEAGFLIASWIVFSLTFVMDLIILAMAWNEDNLIYPEAVNVGFIGSALSWMFMFGYSEMARRED